MPSAGSLRQLGVTTSQLPTFAPFGVSVLSLVFRRTGQQQMSGAVPGAEAQEEVQIHRVRSQ
ncbi:MAG: hypothetical protein BJ554DRAFT_3308 [Olpidium bornovanus]|uniref:Uncharacterized protein n=1 Tax=Olpidium bornovanus TaxID=278681 RepID=A0A8H7ZPC7_9FUNG|nr:MAG: hypothetical protein BJ554DRAFT_3308 [Olpidium bornovanus]